MELQAVLSALQALDGPVEVRSDSTYVVNCFRDRWWEGWLARGWVNSQKKPVANRDLWEPLITAYRGRAGEISFTWVKGHITDPMNDVVDRLAVEASLTQRSRSGASLPAEDDLGPADLPAGRDARLPGGRLVAAFGHRPPELGGYGENPVAAGVRDRLAESGQTSPRTSSSTERSTRSRKRIGKRPRRVHLTALATPIPGPPSRPRCPRWR